MFTYRPLLLAVLAGSAVSANAATREIEEVIVVAHPLSAEGVAQASLVVEGAELQRTMAANIGSTLARQPGIHNSSFGAAVGRPVIQGLGGPRVRVMEDRIDALDVSVTSADHAVSVEPLIADRVEVLKGPSTLLYGSGAIGGVVDVHTGRIPHAVPEDGLTGSVETRFDNNNDGNATTGKLRGGAGSFAFHLDGTVKDGDPYEIPGFAESSRVRAAEAAEEADGGEEEEEEEVRGEVPGSEYDFESFAAGGSVIGDWGLFGISVSRIEADYGLPGGHGHEEEEGGEEEEEEEGNPVLELEQTRFDAELAIADPFSVFSSLNVRLGINDYEHQEIEPSGEVATNFENDAWELRAELTYDSDLLTSVIGLQHQDREFSAVGEEAFVPPVDTTNTGLFWVGERGFDGFDLEAGLRVEQVSHDPSVGRDEDFTTWSGSVGVVVPRGDGWTFSAIGSLATRAPVAEELYSNGPHLATNSFEIGDPTLDEERAANLSATVRYQQDRLGFTATAYITDYSDFIYERFTGEEEDGLPVAQFRQDDAFFYGLDVEGQFVLSRFDGGELLARVLFDMVEAELDISGNDNVPRLSPLRFGVGLGGRWENFEGNIDYLRVSDQDDPGVGEFATDGYNDLSAQLSYRIDTDAAALMLFLRGDNLTDDEQRHHTSFIKGFAPAPGRSVQLGLRVDF